MFYVVQTGNGEASEQLRATEAHHRAWAARHGCEYIAHYGNPAEGDGRTGHWGKVWWLREIARTCADGTKVMVMDTDVLVCRPDVSPKTALQDGFDFAACAVAWRLNPHRWTYNSGVMVWRITEKTRAILDEVWAFHDSETYQSRVYKFYDELAINWVLTHGEMPFGTREPATLPTRVPVQDLAPEWNCWKWHHLESCRDPFIKAWHMTEKQTATRRVKAELERLKVNGIAGG
jgi:hypothetical protein